MLSETGMFNSVAGRSGAEAEPIQRYFIANSGRSVPNLIQRMSTLSWFLDRLDVLCLKAFRSFRDIELYNLAFPQAAEATAVNSGEMHKYVLAILTADEAVAFGIVKPLYCSLFH